MIVKSLAFGLLVSILVYYAIVASANYVQFVIDHSYNRGRLQERACSSLDSETETQMCKEHKQDTGHKW